MAYEKQNFRTGDTLYASQLDAMEDGIMNAERLAMEGAAGAANMEKGTGACATQQLPDGVADGFDFTGKNANATALDATLTGTILYGATGEFASAFGGKCAAQGKRSHAEGTTTIAKGAYSHAEGNSTVTLGNNAHAEGLQTLAKGDHSHSEGQLTQAIGERSHAEGNDTIAKGNNSHVGGWKSETNGAYSFAHGAGVIADVACQVVFGRYNLRTQSAFIVGGGSQEEKRNSFEVRQNGDICMHYNGKMYSLQKIFNALGMFKPSNEIDLSSEITK